MMYPVGTQVGVARYCSSDELDFVGIIRGHGFVQVTRRISLSHTAGIQIQTEMVPCYLVINRDDPTMLTTVVVEDAIIEPIALPEDQDA